MSDPRPSPPCVLPWVNFCTNTFGKARPCGYSAKKGDIKVQDSTISSEFNNELFKSVRRDFLAGKWPENCERCRYMEAAHPGHSKKGSNDIHYPRYKELIGNTAPDGTIINYPKSIDIRLGTVCNLKCIHCGTGNSSRWLDDKELLGKYPNTQIMEVDNSWVDRHNSMWQDIYDHLPEIEKFNFIGGEPFASVQHNKFVEYVSKTEHAQHITLHYVTNGALLSEKLWGIIKSFKDVAVNVSLDATGDVLEFFRYPINAASLEKKLKYFESTWIDTVDLSLQWTSSHISLFYLPETLEYYESTFNPDIVTFRFCNFVDYPAHMSPQNLPPAMKKLIRRRLEPFQERYPEMEIYLKHMEERDLWPEQGQVLRNYLDDLSRVRNLNWRESLREFSKMIEPYFQTGFIYADAPR